MSIAKFTTTQIPIEALQILKLLTKFKNKIYYIMTNRSVDGEDGTIIENIRPYNTVGFVTIIPANTSSYNQSFSAPAGFSRKDYNFISRLVVRVDTSGIWNIPVAETFQKNGVPTVIQPGYYTITQLQAPGVCDLQFSATGPNANKVINNQTLQFSASSNLIYVLGYQDFGTNLIPVNTVAGDTINTTGDLDTLLISNNLVSESTNLGSNPIIVSVMKISTPGEAIVSETNTSIALATSNFSNIQWSLRTAFGKPYIIQTPIIIFTQISSQKRTKR